MWNNSKYNPKTGRYDITPRPINPSKSPTTIPPQYGTVGQAVPPPLMRQGGVQYPFGGFRAKGGRVDPKKRYIVGENGPEEIVLDEPGQVTPLNTDPIHRGQSARESYGNPSNTVDAKRPNLLQDTSGISLQNQQNMPPPLMDEGGPRTIQDPARIAPNVFTSQARPEAGDDPISQQKAIVQDAIAAPAEKQPAWKQALWWGLQGVREAVQPGSGNLQYLGQAQKEERIRRENANLQPLLQQQAQDLEMRKMQAQTQGIEAQNTAAGLELDLMRNPDLAAGIRSGNVTPELANKAQGVGITTSPYDVRPRLRREVNGGLEETPETGAGNWSPSQGASQNLVNTPVQRKVEGQDPYYISGAQAEASNTAAQREMSDITQQRMKIDADYEEEKLKADNSDIKALDNWRDAERKRVVDQKKREGVMQAKAKQVQDLDTQISNLERQLQTESQKGLLADTSKIEDRIEKIRERRSKLEAEVAEANAEYQANSQATPKPTPTKRRTSGRTISRAKLAERAKALGTTVDELLKLPGADRYQVVD